MNNHLLSNLEKKVVILVYYDGVLNSSNFSLVPKVFVIFKMAGFGEDPRTRKIIFDPRKSVERTEIKYLS